jgi:hypothetical protein
MASIEDLQIAKEMMVALLSSEKAQPGVLFAPTSPQGHRFEDWWMRIVKAVEEAHKA